MYNSSKALRLGVSDIRTGEVYTPLHINAEGIIVLKDDHYPPFLVESVDEDRQVVVARYGVIGEPEDVSFADFGLLESGDRCVMLTSVALLILEALRGPRPTVRRFVDVREQNEKALLSGHNLLVPARA